MQKNIGTSDRLIRAVLGIALLILAWFERSWIALAFALFCFYEAVASWCIMYQLLGINSCSIDRDKHK